MVTGVFKSFFLEKVKRTTGLGANGQFCWWETWASWPKVTAQVNKHGWKQTITRTGINLNGLRVAPVQSWIVQLSDGWSCVGDKRSQPTSVENKQCSVQTETGTRRWDSTGFYPPAITSKPQNSSIIILNWDSHNSTNRTHCAWLRTAKALVLTVEKKSSLSSSPSGVAKWHLAAWNSKEDGAGPAGHTAQPRVERFWGWRWI